MGHCVGCPNTGNTPTPQLHCTFGQREQRQWKPRWDPVPDHGMVPAQPCNWRANDDLIRAKCSRSDCSFGERMCAAARHSLRKHQLRKHLLSPTTDVSLFPPSPSAARFAAQALSHPPRMAGSALAASAALHTYATQPSAGPRCGECAEIPDGPIQKRNLSGGAFVCYLQVVAPLATANANSIRIFT